MSATKRNLSSTTYRSSPLVESKMAVLAGAVVADEEEIHQKPFIYVEQLDPILGMTVGDDRKVALIHELAKSAIDGHKLYLLESKLKQRERELHHERMNTDRGVTNRVARTSRRTPGIYIPAEEWANSALGRTSWTITIALIMFAVMQVVEPVFIATVSLGGVRAHHEMALAAPTPAPLINKLCPACAPCSTLNVSNELQMAEEATRSQISSVFFVLTLLMGFFVAYNFVEIREQELRLYFGESDDHQPETRQRELDYAVITFAGVLFLQMVFALYSASHAVNTWHVALLTLVCLALNFVCYTFMVRFERKYRLADRE